MAKRDKVDIAETIGYRVMRLAALMTLQAKPSIKQKLGLPQAQWRLLVHLAVQGAQNPKQVALELGLKRSHVTQAAQALRRRRLLSQDADPNDGRSTVLSLTNTGAKVVRRGHQLFSTRRAQLFADLTLDERTSLDRALSKMTRTVQRMMLADRNPDRDAHGGSPAAGAKGERTPSRSGD